MVSDRQGALVHDVLAVRDGVTTRGVLLDIARLRGVDVLAADDHVHPEDLEAAEQAAGVRVEPGDVVLMRTGEGGARRRDGKNYNANKPRSGFQAACLPWLHERGVAMLGVRRRPGPDADRLPHRAHADPHGRHRRHGPVADRQLPARGPRRHLHPARPMGVPVHAGPDPLPGRHRQPGQPARHLLIAPTRRCASTPRCSSSAAGPAALVVAKLAAGRGVPCLLAGHEVIGDDTPTELDDAAVDVLTRHGVLDVLRPYLDRRARRRRSRRATSRRSSSTTASPISTSPSTTR